MPTSRRKLGYEHYRAEKRIHNPGDQHRFTALASEQQATQTITSQAMGRKALGLGCQSSKELVTLNQNKGHNPKEQTSIQQQINGNKNP